jgi:hypothetical protein
MLDMDGLAERGVEPCDEASLFRGAKGGADTSGRLRRRRHGSENTGMAERVKPRSREAVRLLAQGFTREDIPGEDDGVAASFLMIVEVDIAGVLRCSGRVLSALPITNRKTAYNCPSRIYQTKAVRLSPRVTPGDRTCARLRGCDRLVFARQDGGFPLDRNASAQPVDCEQRGLLPLTIVEAS